MGLVTRWGQLTGACSGRHIRSSAEWGWGEADWAPSPWVSELLERSRSLQGQDTKSGWFKLSGGHSHEESSFPTKRLGVLQ